MSDIQPISKKLTKKDARQLVYNKLSEALSDLKGGVKDKKFESNLQKASKLFAEDLVKAAKAKEKVKKSTKKKAGKKQTESVG